jgi:hypothetical protein
VFDEGVNQELLEGVDQAVVTRRLAKLGVLSGGMLAAIGSLFGIFRLLAWRSTDPLDVGT